MPSSPISDLIRGFARDAVAVQRRIDEVYEEDLCRSLPVAAAAAALGIDGSGVLPARPLVAEQEIDCRLALRAERRVGRSIGATVLSLGYDARYGRAVSSETRLRLTVRQIPSPFPEPTTHP